MYQDYEIAYELSYEYNNESYSYNLDEMCEYVMRDTHNHNQYNIQDSYEMDDEYARDSCDYNELAYRHYAWYNKHTSHEILMYTQARKRIVSVTLDIECYDDLDLQDINWSDILGLEGDENVDVSIRETADIFYAVPRLAHLYYSFWQCEQ